MRDRSREGTAGADLAAIAGITALWAAMVLALHPAGDFALADDWAYASSVRALLERGEIEMRPWTPAIALSHVLWGALASAVLGVSFETLRLSILLLGLGGALATYGLLRELDLEPAHAALGALTLVANPLYVHLSGTFMTDVSFLAASVLALWGFLRFLRSGADVPLWLGTLASLAATLNRQIGLALPLGLAVATLASPHGSRRLRAMAPALLTGAALIAWETFARLHGGPSLGANVKTAEATAFLTGPPIEVAGRLLWSVVVLLIYVGLFTLPFSVVAASARWSDDAGTWRRWIFTLAAAVALTAWLAGLGEAMPLVGNILQPSGIGPATLRDTEILGLPHLPQAPWLGRIVLTAVSVASALLTAGLVAGGLRRVLTKRDRSPDAPCAVLLATVGLLWALSDLIAPYFDRYLLPLVPVAIALAADPLRGSARRTGRAASRRSATLAAAVIALGIVFSVAAVHDYLAWNRARWAAAEWLVTRRGVSPASIDAGFEWNAWRSYDPAYARRPDKSWWWVQDDRWLLAFGPVAGHREIRRMPYRRWLPPGGEGHVLVLERADRSESGRAPQARGQPAVS